MEKDDPLLTAMFEMCNRKNPLNDGQREWSIADLPGLLREGCYDELEARYSRALAESLTSREAEKRYFLAWTQMCNHFYDMDALVEAGPAGLAPIKNWQRARPRSSYAWLAEAQYWNHRAWLYRSYGWRRIPPAPCGSAPAPAMSGWSLPLSTPSTSNHASGWRRP